MANERHTDVRGWEIDSSTRQSVHPYTKYTPFRTATSTTAANLATVGQGEIATNWVTNPRIESTDITKVPNPNLIFGYLKAYSIFL